MRFSICLILILNLAFSKDVRYKIQNLNQQSGNYISLNGSTSNSHVGFESTRITRDDTSTVWLQDFEGDLSDWTVEPGWELTDETSYSPTHSFHADDDNFELLSSIISPIVSIPQLGGENEILKMNFALWADLPDFDGAGDNRLEDYYWVDIANVSDVPVYFIQSETGAYDGQSWWCADPSVGGYLDAWVQVLQSPTITVPAGGNLSAMMQWGIEDPNGAAVGGTCTDGWDAANVRISNDGGATWNLLTGDDPYDFNYGYGWIYNESEYDCGGSLEQVAAGWGGQADWHEVNFDLSGYEGQDVIVQFAFGSDPSYSTPDDATITGFKIDNIQVTDGSGNVVFSDNADDEVNMVPMNGLEFAWEQYFYDYGDVTRPGSLGWVEYPVGGPFNGNAQLDISEYAGDDIRIRFTARMDDNDDGGNGAGLFIDDLHIWKVSYNDVPEVTNLTAVGLDNQVEVTWDMPAGGSYDNDEITYVDGTFEDAIYMSSGTAVMGNYFDMPYGAEASVANSCAVWGEPGLSGPTTLSGFAVTAGLPEASALYTLPITLEEGQWNVFDLGWDFPGDFVLAIEVSLTIGMAIDADNAPSQNSWANLGGWEPWTQVANDYSLTDGEFGLNANVTTVGGGTPVFNVYRSVNGSDFNLMFNGGSLDDNMYMDNTVQNGNEYCYEVTSVYSGDEGNPAGPACATPEAQTIYEIVHDDGTDETSINSGAFNTLCVKFTPEAYPVDLYRASFYCVGSSNGVGFVNVWDDDGDDGMPGTMLVENIPVQFAGGVWTPVSLSNEDIVIAEGSFYVGWMESDATPPIGVDSDNSSENSYIDLGLGIGFEPFGNYFEGAMMIRAEVDSANVLSADDNFAQGLPVSFALEQNYPNPFNPTTTIAFSLPQGGMTNISIYDISGREVENLLGRRLVSGNHFIKYNALNLPSGMYFYSIIVNGVNGESLFSSTKKMILMK